MTRRICYVTGTRADYGLMQQTLRTIADTRGLSLSVLVTGMHLDPRHGGTLAEVERDGHPILARVPLELDGSAAAMARGIAQVIDGCVTAFEENRPDVVLLLGDRGEMLAAAIAAIHLNIAVAHIHGGERSGTVDEPVRHAISKLSHFHLVATEQSRERLIRMGEAPGAVRVVGAPGLVGLAESAKLGRVELAASLALDPSKPLALMLYHPVLQEAEMAGRGTEAIVAALRASGVQIVMFMPNADAGSEDIRSSIAKVADDPDIGVLTHVSRDQFASWMAVADFMIGNSSSGIIEAATFGLPVVNVGSRQNLRERNANVMDVPIDTAALRAAIAAALDMPRSSPDNVFGDGRSDVRIAALLAELALTPALLAKTNAY